MKSITYNLPEWVFLDGFSHQGNSLELRTVLQHIRSYTIIECIAMDEIDLSIFTGKKREFIYRDLFGIEEKHLFVVHFSLAEESELDDILQKAEEWYLDYLKWEDQNIENDATAAHN